MAPLRFRYHPQTFWHRAGIPWPREPQFRDRFARDSPHQQRVCKPSVPQLQRFIGLRQVGAQDDRQRWRSDLQFGKPRLALGQWPRAEILAVEMEKIEQKEDEGRGVAAVGRQLDHAE
jgi:hypothetical protein